MDPEGPQLLLPFDRPKRRASARRGQLVFPFHVAARKPRPEFEGMKRLRLLLAAQIGNRRIG